MYCPTMKQLRESFDSVPNEKYDFLPRMLSLYLRRGYHRVFEHMLLGINFKLSTPTLDLYIKINIPKGLIDALSHASCKLYLAPPPAVGSRRLCKDRLQAGGGRGGKC